MFVGGQLKQSTALPWQQYHTLRTITSTLASVTFGQVSLLGIVWKIGRMTGLTNANRDRTMVNLVNCLVRQWHISHYYYIEWCDAIIFFALYCKYICRLNWSVAVPLTRDVPALSHCSSKINTNNTVRFTNRIYSSNQPARSFPS